MARFKLDDGHNVNRAIKGILITEVTDLIPNNGANYDATEIRLIPSGSTLIDLSDGLTMKTFIFNAELGADYNGRKTGVWIPV